MNTSISKCMRKLERDWQWLKFGDAIFTGLAVVMIILLAGRS